MHANRRLLAFCLPVGFLGGALRANYWRTVGRSFESLVEAGLPSAAVHDIPDYVEGVHLNGRLIVVYSQQSYRDFCYRRPERMLTESGQRDYQEWALRHHPPSDTAIRVRINVVVYALAQEGPLARRYVRREQ